MSSASEFFDAYDEITAPFVEEAPSLKSVFSYVRGKIEATGMAAHLDVVEHERQIVEPVRLRQMHRAHYRTRHDFIKMLADNHPYDLVFLGFSDELIDAIRDAYSKEFLQSNLPAQFSGCSVSHMISLAAGGGNENQNRCILPRAFASLKGVYENAQSSRRSSTMATIVSRADSDGIYPYVYQFPEYCYQIV